MLGRPSFLRSSGKHRRVAFIQLGPGTMGRRQVKSAGIYGRSHEIPLTATTTPRYDLGLAALSAAPASGCFMLSGEGAYTCTYTVPSAVRYRYSQAGFAA
jgi:hypothetical protein